MLLTVVVSLSGSAQKVGEVIYRNDFDSKGSVREWHGTKKYRVVHSDDHSAIRIKSKRSSLLRLELPVAKIRGCKVSVHASIKSKGVTNPPYAWNGIKLMLHIATPWTDLWPQANVQQNIGEWRDANFSTFIPEGTDSAVLVIGLENVSGQVWFDSLEVKVAEEPRQKPAQKPNGAVYTGHTEKRLRGAMIRTDIPEADLEELSRWGANQVRWQLSWHGMPYSIDNSSLEVYQHWLDSVLTYIDKMLPLCRRLHIKVLIDLHSLPGGNAADGIPRIFKEASWQQAFRNIWKSIALRYKDEPAVWGYDLANEPRDGNVPSGLLNWHDLATATARDIRTIDTTHAIIVESTPNGSPDGLAQMSPVDVPGIVYSFHMYVPELFTMQNVDNYYNVASYYPGFIFGKEWNKNTLRQVLQPVVNWQKDYNVQVYIGEFSAARWAPGESAYYYLQDCIELFEEFGWDWSYHAFREYDGWSVEHGPDKSDTKVSPVPTLRQQLLQEWYNKNEK